MSLVYVGTSLIHQLTWSYIPFLASVISIFRPIFSHLRVIRKQLQTTLQAPLLELPIGGSGIPVSQNKLITY